MNYAHYIGTFFSIRNKLLHQILVFIILFIFLFNQSVNAQLKTAGIFGDNAIFQQGIPINIWGNAAPLAKVNISFAGNLFEMVSDKNGKWMTSLPAMNADGKNYELIISSGMEKIKYNNIMLGEVWLASGQSNMEHRVGSDLLNKAEEIKNANFSAIRFRIIDNVTSVIPLNDIVQRDWKICTPANVPSFSSVAYFFARALHLDQHIPVGVIVSARGATSIESWMSKERLNTHPDFTKYLNQRDEDSSHWNEFVRKSIKSEVDRDYVAKTSFLGLKAGVTSIIFNDTGFTKTSFPLTSTKMGYGSYWGLIWIRKTFDLSEEEVKKTLNIFLPIKDQNDHIYLNEKEIAQGVAKMKDKSILIPKGLLKVGKNVLTIRMYVNWGIADIGDRTTNCYIQFSDGSKKILDGDWLSNNKIEPTVAGWQDYYNKPTVNFNGMIYPLIPYSIKGFLWYQGENNAAKAKQYADLQPMLIDDWRVRWKQGYSPFLYVQLANYKARSATPLSKDDWAEFRDAQRSTLSRSINTSMACIIDIGDEYNIHPINKQDVGYRLYQAAKENVYHQNVVGSGPLFKASILQGDQVRISFTYAENGLMDKGNSLNNSFALSDSTGKWFWADAKIDGKTILLSSKDVSRPTQVQYAWQSNPIATVYNAEGLPMVPFNEPVVHTYSIINSPIKN